MKYLVRRGGRTIYDLSYKNFYYGTIWRQDENSAIVNRHARAREKIEQAIAAAMTDSDLNRLLSQYFPHRPITANPLPPAIIDDAPRTTSPDIPFNEIDIRSVIAGLVRTHLANLDLASTAINIILPQGMSLEILGLDEQERPSDAPRMPGVPRDAPFYASGLAGYHGSVAETIAGKPVDVLYSVVAWSDGGTGIPVPNWSGWENIVATLYHELQEIRTNPDVDLAVRSGNNALIGWNTDPVEGPDGQDCREIADLPLVLHNTYRYEAFTRVVVKGCDGDLMEVPIQRIWSDLHNKMMPEIKR
jgi:hypothetical protein